MFVSWGGKVLEENIHRLLNRTNLRRIWNSHLWVLDFSHMPRSTGEASHCTFSPFPLISLNCPFALWVRGVRWLCTLHSPEHSWLTSRMDVRREREPALLRPYSNATQYKLHTFRFNSQNTSRGKGDYFSLYTWGNWDWKKWNELS